MPNEIMTLPEVKDAVKFTMAVCHFDAQPYIDEAKAYVAKYEGLELGEEDCKAVTVIIKELNQKSKSFDDTRKEIKREYNQPLNQLETNIKAIMEVYQATVADLKQKMEIYEVRYRDEKTVSINELIKDATIDLNAKYADRITIVEEYYNKTNTLKKIAKHIADRVAIELANQKNEEMALELQAEREQRRFDMLAQLNANYHGRIRCEVTHVRTAQLSDEQLLEFFKLMEQRYTEELAQEKALREEKEAREAAKAQMEAQLAIEPEDVILGLEKGLGAAPSETPQARVVAEPVSEQRSLPKQTRMIVDFICGEVDTITPWLNRIRSFGITVNIIKEVKYGD